jgi:uncharacterized integral membrane protein
MKAKTIWNILAIILLIFAYTAIEPIIFAYTGWGFFWDYNPKYIPIFEY